MRATLVQSPGIPATAWRATPICSGFGGQAPAVGQLKCCPCSWIYFTQSSPACQEDEEEFLAKQELGPGPQGGLICLSTVYTTELGPIRPPAC